MSDFNCDSFLKIQHPKKNWYDCKNNPLSLIQKKNIRIKEKLRFEIEIKFCEKIDLKWSKVSQNL